MDKENNIEKKVDGIDIYSCDSEIVERLIAVIENGTESHISFDKSDYEPKYFFPLPRSDYRKK